MNQFDYETTLLDESLNRQDYLHDMFEQAPIGMCILGPNQTLLRVNRVLCDMMGYSEAEMLGGGDYAQYIHADSRAESVNLLHHFYSGTIDRDSIEMRCRRKDGSIIWVQVRASPVHYPGIDGEVLFAVAQDISVSKHHEEVVQRQLAIMEGAMDGMALLDKNARYIYLNTAHAKLFGYDESHELIGMTWHVLYEDQEISRFEREIFPLLLRDEQWQGEVIARRRDGSKFHEGLSLTLMQDGTLICVCRDITKQKRLEERFRRVIEAAPTGKVMVDVNGLIVLVNAQTEKMFGYERAELIGQSIEKLIPERYRHGHPRHRIGFFVTPIARAMGAGRDLYALRKDGSEFAVEIGLNPIDTEDGPMVLSAIVDITERKHAQEQLLASLREKEILLQEVHHRVKNNLQIVSSLLNLQSGYVHDQVMEQMIRASQARLYAMALIHEMLYHSSNLSQIDFAKYAINLSRYLLRAHGMESRDIKLDTNFESVQMNVNTAITCGLILNELVSNCLKHAFSSGHNGTVYLKLSKSEDSKLTLIVADDGNGLPSDFDADGNKTLGMRIVHALGRQLKGTLEIFSGNPGTTIRFTFGEQYDC